MQSHSLMRFSACAWILGLSLLTTAHAQSPEAGEILSRSIRYHDPGGEWGSYQGSFLVVMETPGEPPRRSEIHLDQAHSGFSLKMSKGEAKWSYEVNGDQCALTFGGAADFSEEVAREYRLTCERAKMYRDYYSYLYGLPMKLRDPGTRISPKAEKRSFHGKEYWVLEVRYDPGVGKDLWYFYFNPDTYALEAYQFYHDREKNDGEYILMEGIQEISGMRWPKIRTWYTNKDQKLLGTDTLKN